MLKPIKSEKSLHEVAAGRFTFAVPIGLNKTEIRSLIQKTFPVQVIKVHTQITPGKSYRTGKKGSAYRPNVKKAVVTLKKGQKIDLFENIS